jgi:hypothetical protein
MTSSSDTEALRVAVLVESFVVPQWVEWTVARIVATEVVPAVVELRGGGLVVIS